MKRTKKLLGLFLSLAVAVGLFISTPITADAAYTYKIKLSLGNNENASFEENTVSDLASKGYTASLVKNSKGVERTLVIEGLGYDAQITVDLANYVKITVPDVPEGEMSTATTYYVKGIKRAGSDKVEDAWSTKAPYCVEGDQTFVVAYGVGATVPYLIQYVDLDGNKLFDDEIEYGAKGEILKVPARYKKGYRSINPKNHNQIVNFLTNSAGLKDAKITTDENGNKVISEGATVFKFVYKKLDPSTIYNENTEYRNQYEEITSSGTEGGTQVIDRRGGNGGGQPAGNAGGGNAGGEAAGEGGGAEPAPAPAVEPSPEPDTIDIDDEDVARAGGEPQDKLVRNMIVAIVIAIIAVLSILVALIVADRKRKAQIANTNRKDDNE